MGTTLRERLEETTDRVATLEGLLQDVVDGELTYQEIVNQAADLLEETDESDDTTNEHDGD